MKADRIPLSGESDGAASAGGCGSVVELKARGMTVFVFEVRSTDAEEFLHAVDARIARAPAMFRQVPVALEFGESAMPPAAGALDALTAGLRERGLVPVAVAGQDPEWLDLAERAGLAVLNGASPRERDSGPGDDTAETAQARGNRDANPATRFIERPVRSGQQVYAPEGDLVVLGAVGAGAEVVAAGSVHVYGALHGRAVAGVHGDESARVLCQQFNAELVSIAGHYQVGEDLPVTERNRPEQVRLDGHSLVIGRLDAG